MDYSSKINGLKIGHIKQIIRRSMLPKIKPSKKQYNRKKEKKSFGD